METDEQNVEKNVGDTQAKTLNNNLVFIHIGKCGGSTVGSELRSHNIKFTGIHITKVKYDSTKKYIIVIRNPIQRFISAFNWRYDIVCYKKLQQNRFKNEKNILNKYKNIDNLCQDLKLNQNIFNGNKNSGNYIHHLREDIFFYLEKFIDECPKKQIFGIICTETLKKDIKNIFNINVIKHKNNNKKYDKNISDENYQILKSYLKNDYNIIDKMYKYGWINNEQYLFLKS